MQALVTSKDGGDSQVNLSARNPEKAFAESLLSDQRHFSSCVSKYTHTSPVAYIETNSTACTPKRSKSFYIRSPTDGLGLRHPDVFNQYRRPKKQILMCSSSSPNSEPGTPVNIERIKRTYHTQKRLNFKDHNLNSDTTTKRKCFQIDDTLQLVVHDFKQLTFDDMSKPTGTAGSLVDAIKKQPPLCFAKACTLLKEIGGQLSGRCLPIQHVKRRDSAKKYSSSSGEQIKEQLSDQIHPLKRRDSDKEHSSSSEVRDNFLNELRPARSLKRRNSCPCSDELEESCTPRLKRKKLNNSVSDSKELRHGKATRRKRRKSDSSELRQETGKKHEANAKIQQNQFMEE